MSDRTTEQRVRRLAKRLGYQIHKSRQQEHADNFGEFMLVCIDPNCLVLGDRFNASLEEIEAYLNTDAQVLS